MAAPPSRAARCRDGRAPRAPRTDSGMSPLSSIEVARPAVFSARLSLAAVESFFALHARKITLARELRGGMSTFLTMAYILFATPAILRAAGLPFEAAVAATAAAAAICSILMGVVANVPIALAPGIGLNAVVAFHLVGATGSWQAAMGLVVVEGLAVLALVLVGAREAVMTAIPFDLRRAI